MDGVPQGIVANMLVWDIVASEFEHHTHYCIHFWTTTLGRGMNLLISQLWVK